jgi:hypothetical protein
MAVENDYNLLVAQLGYLAQNSEDLRREVSERLLREQREGLEPNATRWVQLLTTRLPFISGPATQIEHEAVRVLRSRPGETALEAQPPESPDAPPE